MSAADFNLESALLYAVADDYEDFQTVLKTVTEWAIEEGVQLSPDAIRKGLCETIRKGLIDAKAFSGGSYSPVASVNAAQLTTYWFCTSKQGAQILKQLGPRSSA
jgi:hypothetical protein